MSEITRPRQVLRPAQLAKKFSVSVPTVYRRVRQDPHFPQPFKLSERVTGFYEDEADAYLASRRAIK